MRRSLASLAREREARGAKAEATSAATTRKGRGGDSSKETIEEFAEALLPPRLRAFRDDAAEKELSVLPADNDEDAVAPTAEGEAIGRRRE